MTIKYEVVSNPLQEGTYYPRVVAGSVTTMEELLPSIVTKTTLSATDVRAAIDALVEEVTAHLANGRPVQIEDLCAFRVSLSQTLTAPDAEVTSDVVVRTNVRAVNDLRKRVAAAARLEKVVRGVKRPIITSFVDVASGQPNRYTPASIGRITGGNLKFDPDAADQGIFFIAEDGSEVRAQVYSHIGDTQIAMLVPVALSGPQQLTVRTRYHDGGQLRSGTYDSQLVAA